MEGAAAEVPAVGAEPKPAASPLPSPRKQAAPPASQLQVSQALKQASAAEKAQRTVCPACGAPPLTEAELQTVRKPGRRSTRDANDPRNRPENLVKTEFLQQHILHGGMSLREISAYHGYTISTLSRRAKQLGVQVGRLPRVPSDSEQASEGTAVRSPAPTPPRKRPQQDKQQGKEEQQGTPSKRRRARQPEQQQGQPAKGGGAAGPARTAPPAPKPAAAAAAAAAAPAAASSNVSTGAAAPAAAPAAGNAAGEAGRAEDPTAAKRRRRPSQPAEKPGQAAPQRPLVPLAVAPGMAAATAAAAAMGPLLALPVKPVDLQKSNLGPAAAQLVHLWHPPSKDQLEIWQAVQAQAAAAAAATVQAQRPANALPLWQPVLLPGSAGVQHSPLKPPCPPRSQQQQQQKASPAPPRRRAVARQPQSQLSMLEDSDDEEAIAGLVSLRLQSTEPSAGQPPTAAVTTAAGPAAAAVAGPALSTGAVRRGGEPLVAMEAAAAASIPAAGGAMAPAAQAAAEVAPASPVAAEAAPAAQAAAEAEEASPAAATAAAGPKAAAAEAAAAPAPGVAAQVEVKREPRAFTPEQQQGAAAPAAAQHGEQLSQDEQEAKGVRANQQQQQGQQAVPARLSAEPQGAVDVKSEQPSDPRGDAGLAANGHRPAVLLPAALQAEAQAGGGSRVGSQPSEDIEVQALLALPGTQQSACCPAEEAALLCMLPAQQQQQRRHLRDGGHPQPLAQSAAPPAQQQDVQQFQPQNGAAAPHTAADADATPAASTGSPTLPPEMERVYAHAAQQVLQNLPAAFEKADTSCAASMLRPLGRLLLAGQGGHTLRDIVAGWAGYSLPQQQEIFSTAVLVASAACWQDLEDQLKLALELID